MPNKTDKKDEYQRRDRRKAYRQARDKEVIAVIKEIIGAARSQRHRELHYLRLPLDRVIYTHYSSSVRDTFEDTVYNLSEWQMLLEETKAEIISLAFDGQGRCIRFSVKIHPELHDRWVSSGRDIKAEIREALTKQLKALGIEHMAFLFIVEGRKTDGSKCAVHIHGMAVSPDSRDDALFKKAVGRATGNGTRGRPSVSHAVHMDEYNPTLGWIGYITKNLPKKDDRLGEKRFAFCRKATEMGRTLYNALLGRSPVPIAAPGPVVAKCIGLGGVAASSRRIASMPRHDRGSVRSARRLPEVRWAA